MWCNCFDYQDLRTRQLQLLVCLARVYDVDGTSVGPVHRASVGTVDTFDHYPAGTSGPPLLDTVPELARQRARSQLGAVDGPLAGNFVRKVLASHALSVHQFVDL